MACDSAPEHPSGIASDGAEDSLVRRKLEFGQHFVQLDLREAVFLEGKSTFNFSLCGLVPLA